MPALLRRPAPRCCGTPWPGGCGRGPPSTVYRALARLVGLTEAELRRLVRVSLRQGGRVPEARGGPLPRHHPPGRGHRLPLPGLCRPAAGRVHRRAARGGRPPGRPAVAVPCPALDEDQGVTLTARWGEQLDVRHITAATTAGELSGRAGRRLHRQVRHQGHRGPRRHASTSRIGDVDLDDLDVPAHVAELVRACWELGGRPSLAGCGCGSGRTCSASAATSRPRAAATRPPWVPCVGPGLPTPSAAGPRRRPPVGRLGPARGRPGRDRRCLLDLPRVGLSDDRGGVAGASAAARAREERRIAKEELEPPRWPPDRST